MTTYADSNKSSPYLHGNFLVIWDTGVILLGPAGCGKSDISLQLLDRGHTLVADDLVGLYEYNQQLRGYVIDDYAGWIYLHNLGFLHISHLYPNNTPVLTDHRIDLLIELKTHKRHHTSIDPWLATPFQQYGIKKTQIDAYQQRPTSLLIETLVKGFLT